jgi:hypothetical protein
MLHPELETRFRELLVAWRRYQAVRRSPRSLPELADARCALDDARNRMHDLRARLAPEADEATIADTATVCPHLETLSFVLHGLCGCGTRVAAAGAMP